MRSAAKIALYKASSLEDTVMFLTNGPSVPKTAIEAIIMMRGSFKRLSMVFSLFLCFIKQSKLIFINNILSPCLCCVNTYMYVIWILHIYLDFTPVDAIIIREISGL